MRVKSDRFQLYNMPVEYFIQFMLHIGACSSVIHTVVDQSVRNDEQHGTHIREVTGVESE